MMNTVGQVVCFFLTFVVGTTMLVILILWGLGISLLYAIPVPVLSFVIFYLSLPMVFIFSQRIQRYFVYLAGTRRPPEAFNYNDTASAGLAGCRNFYLCHDEGTEHIGVWHLLPQSLIHDSGSGVRLDRYWKHTLQHSEKHIVIYFHGNTGTRALDHRKELYWLLQNVDCHIIAFDYRGFADSSPAEPSEETTVEDGLLVYRWVREVLGRNDSDNRVFIWGHSLGTGIASHVVARLESAGDPPAGIILESPFTNIGEALRFNKKAFLYKYFPNFTHMFVRPLHQNGIAYQTDCHIESILTPILILHATDDETIPFSLGRKLFNHGRHQRPPHACPIHFKAFPTGYGHKMIYTSPELPEIISGFIRATIHNDWVSFNSPESRANLDV